MFQQLVSGIQLPQTDSDLKLDSIIPPFQPITKCPTCLTHPCVQFWTNEDFTAWLDSPDGLRANRGKVPYLEDENGDPLTDTIIKSIWKLLHGAWAELIRRKLASKTWGKVSATARQVVHTLMENTYPLFKLSDNGWKLDYLISSSYSAWRQNHIDDYGNWKKKDIDDKEDENEESSGCSYNTKGKKCKQPKSLKSDVPEKKMKGCTVSNCSFPREYPTTSIEYLSCRANGEGEYSPPPHPIIKINMTNPLSMLALAAVGTMIPPLPPSIDPPLTLSAPCPTAMKGPGKAGDATNERGSKISKGKMRPTQTKNGCNLCAHCWLKQVESNKTTEEFSVYYLDLLADQRKKYDTEAAELVANNAWDKKAYKGTLH
ncbi:hypothetical protein BDR05DRAFT_950449 [Suillus weaverae]|nr:hypothetical protein BDR05DRAFT_950449 [Suillus weaverae]